MFLIFLFLYSLMAIRGETRSVPVFTKPAVIAVRGRSVTLPCRFSGEPLGVYWYRHDETGAPDSESRIVVQNYKGENIFREGAKFNITSDYSMVIYNVTVGDETTYSCRVVLSNFEDGKDYTNVTVIALADPLHPHITDCIETGPGRCEYRLAEVVPESFTITCTVNRVRPPVVLTWTTADGEKRPADDVSAGKPDKDGLYNVSLRLLVSKSETGQEFTCVASGNGVNGSSSLIVRMVEHQEKDSRHLVPGIVAGILVLSIAIIIVFIIILFRKTEYFGYRKLECKLTAEREKIHHYTPGSLSPVKSEGLEPDTKTTLAVYGVPDSGMSSFIRSLLYAVKDTFSKIETAPNKQDGAATFEAKEYIISNYILIKDFAGLGKMDDDGVKEIIQNIRKDKVRCPILVFHAGNIVEDDQSFYKSAVDEIRRETSTSPAIVLTHKSTVRGKQSAIKKRLTDLHVPSDWIFFVDNFTTEEQSRRSSDKKLAFLKQLVELLKIADVNMSKVVKKDTETRKDDETPV